MNNISLKFDYTKTINEQLPTFNYYKNKYVDYEMEILNLTNEKQQLISFLEDKVKDIKTMYSQINGDYGLMNDKLNAFQEVLDFIRGEKDEN